MADRGAKAPLNTCDFIVATRPDAGGVAIDK